MFHILGILSGFGAFIADIPYIIDTYKRKTKPHRTTWFLFTLINLIFFANQLAAGAHNSLGLIVGFTFADLVIALLSLRNGTGGLDREDIAIAVIALIGIILWLVLKAPIASILANILAAFVAAIPTIKKAWRDPNSETEITWILAALASLLGAISVGKWDLTLLLLPVYSVVSQLIIYLIIVRKKLFK